MEDAFDRPTATPVLVGRWLGELARVPVGLMDAYVPGLALDGRSREQLILAVTEVNGCRWSAWVHGAWLDFLGPRDPDEVLEPLFAYARACAEEGRPLDTTVLEASYPPEVVRSVRAVVARTELANLVGNTTDGVLERLLGRRPPAPMVALQEAATVAAALPFVAPMAATAAVMRTLTGMAPRLPTVEFVPDGDDVEPNLVAHLLAEAVPTYLGHTFVRTGLLLAPVNLAVAVRMEGRSATLRVGRRRVSVSNGVSRDALIVLEGGTEPLLKIVAGSILRDVRTGRPLRRA